MTDLAASAKILLRAAAKARSLNEATVVVKLGGSAMEDPAATAGTLDSIAAMHQFGLSMILVHGGGKPIDRAMAEEGLEPRKVQGRRYTDPATLEVVVRVLGELSAGLAEELEARQIPNLAMHDPELHPIRAKILTLNGDDLGLVGQPKAVDTERLKDALATGMVPVVPSLALNDAGEWLNVNADTAASAIAGTLRADTVYFLTDTPGVLANLHDAASLLPSLSVAESKKLIERGIIAGGMIPKVEACFEALQLGAKRAVILDGRNPYALLAEFTSDSVLGTEILP